MKSKKKKKSVHAIIFRCKLMGLVFNEHDKNINDSGEEYGSPKLHSKIIFFYV